ncbi:hypothetical protein Zm00014a_026737 [Zea mays]|uniref:Uncharacterized protein n=1 Tax=Zea mays TaxID=4577 RepID=A0A3L6D8D5_MAIZE|nr:hypothetical protein Zm00014a_026737 [Zea mays]
MLRAAAGADRDAVRAPLLLAVPLQVAAHPLALARVPGVQGRGRGGEARAPVRPRQGPRRPEVQERPGAADIPSRPAGQRPATAPQADPNNAHFPNAANPANPWFMGGGGGGIPLANAALGELHLLGGVRWAVPAAQLQVHGFPDATAYGQPAGFPYGYGHGHAFHGGHAGAHAHAAAAAPRHAQHQQQQADVYLKALLIWSAFW